MKSALLILALLFSAAASAQSAPEVGTVTLTVSPATGKSPVTPVLTWSTTTTPDGTAASSCSPSWAPGTTVAASGTVTLPAITATTTYTLSCSYADTAALLSWSAPANNTDGSAIGGSQLPLTYSVNEGPSGAEVQIKSGISGLTFTATALPAATNCFTVNVTDALSDTSAPTNQVCKTNGTTPASANAKVTVQPVPNAAGSLAVQ